MELINYDGRHRQLIEPFHGHEFSPPLGDGAEYPFVDAKGKINLQKQIRRVARGGYISAIVTNKFPRAFYRGLLVKDVSSHLIIDQIVMVMESRGGVDLIDDTTA